MHRVPRAHHFPRLKLWAWKKPEIRASWPWRTSKIASLTSICKTKQFQEEIWPTITSSMEVSRLIWQCSLLREIFSHLRRRWALDQPSQAFTTCSIHSAVSSMQLRSPCRRKILVSLLIARPVLMRWVLRDLPEWMSPNQQIPCCLGAVTRTWRARILSKCRQHSHSRQFLIRKNKWAQFLINKYRKF